MAFLLDAYYLVNTRTSFIVLCNVPQQKIWALEFKRLKLSESHKTLDARIVYATEISSHIPTTLGRYTLFQFMQSIISQLAKFTRHWNYPINAITNRFKVVTKLRSHVHLQGTLSALYDVEHDFNEWYNDNYLIFSTPF